MDNTNEETSSLDKETGEIIQHHTFENFEKYRKFLDKEPEESWVKLRDIGGKNHEYIPDFVISANGDLMYREWYVVDETYIDMNNGVACTLKIRALPDYPGAEWISFTGTGGVFFKKSKNAVEFDPLAARTKAINKAFQTLGNVFGRNLNKKYKDGGKEYMLPRGFSFLGKDEK